MFMLYNWNTYVFSWKFNR